MHKKGSGYDLPIALGIIAASEQMEMPGLTDYVIVGELGLDGTVRDVAGGIPISELAQMTGAAGCILPFNSAIGAACFKNGPVYGIHNLKDALSIVCNRPEKEELLVTQTVVRNGNACTDDGMISKPILEFLFIAIITTILSFVLGYLLNSIRFFRH